MIGQYNGDTIASVHCTLFQLKNLDETKRKLLSSKWITDDYRRINDYLMRNMATMSEKKLYVGYSTPNRIYS